MAFLIVKQAEFVTDKCNHSVFLVTDHVIPDWTRAIGFLSITTYVAILYVTHRVVLIYEVLPTISGEPGEGMGHYLAYDIFRKFSQEQRQVVTNTVVGGDAI